MHVKLVCISANPLPKSIYYAASVPYDNSFLLIGGYGSGTGDLADIYKYNPDNDEWTMLESELKTPRYRHVALLVPQSIFPECN